MHAQRLNSRRSRRLNAKRRSSRRHTSTLEQLEQRNLLATLDTILGNEHADITLGYAAETWTLSVDDNDNFEVHSNEDALLYLGAPAMTSRVAGSAFDFIGVESGEDFYRLPQNQDPDVLFLGFAGGVASGVFDRYNPSAESKDRVSGLGRWLKASLVGVQHTTPEGEVGDGHFSAWQSGDTGPVVFMSTYDDGVSNPNGNGLDATDGIGPDDAVWVTAGGHLHYNFGFTQPGRYEVSLRLSGYLDDGNTTSLGQFTESEPLTAYFSVDNVGELEFDASTYVVNEEAGTASVTVRRVGGSDGQLTVDYATSDGSAEADTDYTSTSDTLTFEDQRTWNTITIPILADDAAEADETVGLALTDPGPANFDAYRIDVLGDANGLLSAQATATLTITEVDDPAGTFDAKDDAYFVHGRNMLVGNVLFNDTDPDRAGLTTTLATEPTNGNVVLAPNGSFMYTPTSGFEDSDRFTYTVSDGSGELDTAIVTIAAAAPQDFAAGLKMGHADVGVAYEDGGWDLHVHDEETDTEYEPDEVLLTVGPQAEGPRADGAAFDFIGVGAGESYWRLPDVDNPELLFLGVGGEEIATGTFQGGQVELHLKSVNGPGQFSVWQNTDTGPAVAMASSDGITADDRLNVLEGGHAHYNWGFTARGRYEVTFEATGTLANGTATASGEVTYFFDVPFASDDSYTVVPGNAVRGNVLFNDTAPDGASLTATVSTEPTKGTLALAENGAFTYMPNSSFDGSDSFTYTVSNDDSELGTATVTVTAAVAQDFTAVLKKGHADVGVAYEDRAWDLHVHDEETDTEYEPDEVLLYVGPPAQSVRPADVAFDFIGVGAGEGYWRLPDVDNPELLFLGIGGEELVAGTFQGGQVELHLKAVNGPGQFSVWQNTDSGPAVAMATSDGITTADSLSVLEGGHAHYNWGFTAQGGYEVTFEATGTLADGTAVASGDVTYFFEVPVAIDDAYTVGNGNQVVGNVLFNDIPPAGAALIAAVSTAPTKGAVVLDANGSFTYTPDGSFDGSDSFTYAVSDDGSELDSATVTITAAVAQDFAAVLKMGHADVGVAYEDGAWDLHVHDEETDTEYEPGDVLLSVGPQAEGPRADGAAFDFIGVGAGETYWRLPDVDNPELLFLGIGGEELAAGTFLGGQVDLHLKALNGPGEFSVWQNTDTGPMVAMATSDGITGDDSLSVLEGGHSHYNWGFTALGAYEVTVEATGTLANGTEVASGDVTYFFEVVAAAIDDAYAVTPGNAVRGNVLFNDVAPGDDPLTAAVSTEPTKGALVLNVNGSFEYTPNASFDGSDSFTYTVSDDGELDTATVTITAAAAQDFDAVLKKGHADVGVAYEDGAWDLHVHDEETDTEYEPDEVLLYVGPEAQSVRPVDAAFDFIGVGAGEGYWRLPDVDNPELLFLGIGGEELVAGTFQGGQVELHLKAVNGPGQFSVWQNTDSGPAVAMATSDGITGDDSLSVLEGGHAHYNWGFTAQGGYEVTFEATGILADGTAVASGDVTYFFEVPVAIDDAYTVGDGNQVVGNVLFNDIPPAGAVLTAAVSTAPTKGAVVLDANGSFTYTPDGSFDGSDSFTYAVSDDGSELDSATVTITAAAAQDFAAVLKMGHADVGVAYEDGAWDLHVHDEETDTEYEPGDVLLSVGPQAEGPRADGAAFDFIGVGAGETYWRLPDVDNPELLFLGIGGEELAAGTFLGGQVDLHLKALNGPGEFSVWQNTDTGPMVAMATSDGITGDDSLSVLEGGHSHYNWGFTALGAYEVTVEATGTLANGTEVASGDVTYFFEVVAAAIDDAYAVTPGNAVRGNVLFNDVAPGDDPLTAAVTTEPTKGALVLNANGSFEYTPNDSFDGSDSFTYTASDDGELDTATVTITAAAAQDFDAVLKKGHADVGVAYEDGAWDLHVHDEETDTEYEPDEVLLYVGPEAQSVRPVDAAFDFIGVGAGEGYWRLPDVDNPELLFLGIGGEELVAGTFQGGQVELHLKSVNGPGQFSVWQNTDTGPAVAMATSDGITTADSLSVLEGGHAHYNWGFTAQGGYEVTFEATGTLADGTAVASGDVTYFFEVPVAIDDAYTVGAGNQVVGNVLFNDIPPAGATLTAAVSTAPTKGAVVLDANGSFTYTPDGTFDGSDSFTYAVSDDGSELDSATVTITAAAAQNFAAVLKMGHADVGVAYEDGAWDLHLHDEETDTEYEPGDVLLYVGPQAASDRAEGAAFDFIGVAAGETYWRLPDVDNPELLFLGIGGEELEAGTFLGGQVELHLKNVNGPGQFSVWQNTDTGPMVAMATSDGITGDDSLSVLEGGHSHYNWGFSETGSYRVTFEATGTLANGDVVHSGDVTYFFAVNPPVMSVTSLDSNSSGFVASFSADLGANGLNLFDTMADELGPADVTLVGSEVGAVAGSLIVDPALREVTFIKTGGPLEPDTYTVTLRSAADGFVDIAGQLLDGDGDGAEGGDYVTTFTIAEPAADTITLGIPDFVRGPGQPVNVPATAAGLPITLSDGENVQAVDLRIAYDPAMLSITGAEVAAGLPAGATVTVNTDTAGIAIIAFVSPSPLPAETQTIINLQASIPSGIAGGTQRLELHEATVVDGSSNQLPLLLDDGYQFVGYFGDVSGNGTINAIDASRVAQFAAQLDSGFAGALLTDPMILADISGNGRVNALDASLIAQFAALLDVPEIPPLPVQGTAVASGALAGIGTLLDHRDGDDPLETTRATTEPIANCDSPEDCSSYPPAVVDRLLAGSPEPAEATDIGRSEAWEVAVDELLGAIDEGNLLSD